MRFDTWSVWLLKQQPTLLFNFDDLLGFPISAELSHNALMCSSSWTADHNEYRLVIWASYFLCSHFKKQTNKYKVQLLCWLFSTAPDLEGTALDLLQMTLFTTCPSQTIQVLDLLFHTCPAAVTNEPRPQLISWPDGSPHSHFPSLKRRLATY